MKKNRFSEKVSLKSSSELDNIISTKENYDKRLILAVLWELETRNELSEKLTLEMVALEDQMKLKEEILNYEKQIIPPGLPITIKWAAVSTFLVFLTELIGILAFNRVTYISISGIDIPGSSVTLVVGVFMLFGKKWAQYALYLTFAFSTLLFFVLISSIDIIGVLEQLFITVSFILILKKSSRNWYKKRTKQLFLQNAPLFNLFQSNLSLSLLYLFTKKSPALSHL